MADAGERSGSELRCPVCGRGRLQDLSHDAGTGLRQAPESRELQRFTCGHVVTGASLETADQRALDVERRHSEETVDPAPAEPGSG